jgi:hypothetical protein
MTANWSPATTFSAVASIQSPLSQTISARHKQSPPPQDDQLDRHDSVEAWYMAGHDRSFMSRVDDAEILFAWLEGKTLVLRMPALPASERPGFVHQFPSPQQPRVGLARQLPPGAHRLPGVSWLASRLRSGGGTARPARRVVGGKEAVGR